jgi:hypothetical protein
MLRIGEAHREQHRGSDSFVDDLPGLSHLDHSGLTEVNSFDQRIRPEEASQVAHGIAPGLVEVGTSRSSPWRLRSSQAERSFASRITGTNPISQAPLSAIAVGNAPLFATL